MSSELIPPVFPRVMPQGMTRSNVTAHYAFLTPDTFVASTLVGWEKTRGVVQISPRMGAHGAGPGFVQYEAWMLPESVGMAPTGAIGVQRFVYVLAGEVSVTLTQLSGGTAGSGGVMKGKAWITNETRTLKAGGFAYLPSMTQYEIRTTSAGGAARLLVIEKPYDAASGHVDRPAPMSGQEQEIAANTFMGDEFLQLKLLLPDIPEMDMAVNIFTYTPGGTLPQVEIHVMEHGLMMIQGTGVYRLGSDWFPCQNGDVIWMAPYCEQWFCATAGPGELRVPARYIYYKDVNRNPLG